MIPREYKSRGVPTAQKSLYARKPTMSALLFP